MSGLGGWDTGKVAQARNALPGLNAPGCLIRAFSASWASTAAVQRFFHQSCRSPRFWWPNRSGSQLLQVAALWA
jgi:hypothetical protein